MDNFKDIKFLKRQEVFWWYISFYDEFNQAGIVKYNNKKYLATIVEFRNSFPDPLIWGIYEVDETIMNSIWFYKTTVEKDSLGYSWTLLNDDGNPLSTEEQKTSRLNPFGNKLNPKIQNITLSCIQYGTLIGYVCETYSQFEKSLKNKEINFRKIRNYKGII